MVRVAFCVESAEVVEGGVVVVVLVVVGGGGVDLDVGSSLAKGVVEEWKNRLY